MIASIMFELGAGAEAECREIGGRSRDDHVGAGIAERINAQAVDRQGGGDQQIED